MKMYTGETGSGKTYKAINEAKGKFCIIVPCRQLAYEVFMDYPQIKSIKTGEVSIDNGGNYVMVYECLQDQRFDTVIIDEAHHLVEKERGPHLSRIMERYNCVLCTATDSIGDEIKEKYRIKTEHLDSLHKVKKKHIKTVDAFLSIVNKGAQFIHFTKYMPSDEYIEGLQHLYGCEMGVISSKTKPSDRLEMQIRFRNRELQGIISTNVLAQGLNFPCEAVFIEYNEHDGWETIEQKIGRLCRFGTGVSHGYYYVQNRLDPGKVDKLPEEVNNYVDLSVSLGYTGPEKFKPHEYIQPEYIQHYLDLNYSDIRYCRRYLRLLRELGIKVDKYLEVLGEEEDKVREILQNYKYREC